MLADNRGHGLMLTGMENIVPRCDKCIRFFFFFFLGGGNVKNLRDFFHFLHMKTENGKVGRIEY